MRAIQNLNRNALLLVHPFQALPILMPLVHTVLMLMAVKLYLFINGCRRLNVMTDRARRAVLFPVISMVIQHLRYRLNRAMTKTVR
ncbi:hypothetical protein SAMN02745729_13126 [Marinobacterium iners DSM 11526]|uniref:Uncharacterized protein n=1 Tax=Marinobacterium iners DSM 11526 TaxID=1122198 RepID=A0A1H4H8F3_9GAMM|nr:hypothetical protein SAMN02745729_13126 [Marinobacterium iners DSM 11526]